MIVDWQMLAAAIAATNTSQMFFRDIATFINETPTSKLTLGMDLKKRY